MENNIINISNSTPKLSVIGINDPGSLKLKSPGRTPPTTPKRSVNFGPGLELLMNPKKTHSGAMKSDINLNDLNTLDKELNSAPPLSKKNITSKIFNTPFNSGIKLNITEINKPKMQPKPTSSSAHTATLGQKIGGGGKEKTWDGYQKFNEIPVNPNVKATSQPQLNAEETVRQKIEFLRKLNHLEKKGIKLTKKYSMEDPLAAVKAEYDMLKNEKEKTNSVKFQGKMMMAFVSALEFLNNRFDPFELKLDGWAEAVNENIEDYDDVFGELHEKYGDKAKMAPEIKLIFMLGGSAAMLHMTNTMFKSAMPGMDDIMRQNPELMSQFTQAAANTMGRENPGFGGFMNMMGGTQPPPGAPPAPNDEQKHHPPVPPMSRPNYADVGMGRGNPEFRDAVNMEHAQADPFREDRQRTARKKRREMKGPSDLDDILSGLKTKKINLKSQEDNKSVVSVESIRELGGKSAKRKKSRNNNITMSLNGLI